MCKTKICNKCNVEKTIDQFYFDKKQKYYDGRCMECRKLYRKQYDLRRGNELKRNRIKNKKIIDHNFINKEREYARLHRANNPKQYILRRIKNRAKLNDIEFNLTIDDIDIPLICPVLGIPIVINKGFGPGSPSVDRIDPNKGYIKGNICIISQRANTLKNNGTVDEFMKIIDYIRKMS